MKEIVIEKIIKGGCEKRKAIEIVERWFDMAIRHGNETVAEIADAITWYSAV